MKRFRWRLQAVLDVAAMREQSARLEMFRLAAQATSLRQGILAVQQEVRDAFAELAKRELPERLSNHQVMLTCAETARQEIQKLERNLAQVRKQRDETLAKVVALRSRRKTLEQLREEAQRKYIQEYEALEQKQMDDLANVRSARQSMGARA